jgi:hypothetical protein
MKLRIIQTAITVALTALAYYLAYLERGYNGLAFAFLVNVLLVRAINSRIGHYDSRLGSMLRKISNSLTVINNDVDWLKHKDRKK